MADEATFRPGTPVVKASTPDEMRQKFVEHLRVMATYELKVADQQQSKAKAHILRVRGALLLREADYWESVVIKPSTRDGDTP